jgi:hypothetical protein
MTGTSVEIKDPTQGAAYRVLYERYKPFLCFTREAQAELNEQFASVKEWLKTQNPKVRKAYDWAIDMIEKQVERQVGATEMDTKVAAAHAAIPQPPLAPWEQDETRE